MNFLLNLMISDNFFIKIDNVSTKTFNLIQNPQYSHVYHHQSTNNPFILPKTPVKFLNKSSKIILLNSFI